jgi:hypothetical protein
MAVTRLTKQEREALPAADFADSEHKLYPIMTAEDVEEAVRLFSRARNGAKLRDAAIEICKRKQIAIPAAWQSAMSAEFSVSGAASAKRDDPERPNHVLIPAPVLFRCDNYPDKNFSLTPEEAEGVTLAEFSPVDLDLEHKPTVLSGKLGVLARVDRSEADPYLLSGEVSIPKWLDNLLGPDERKLSAAFCRTTKKIIGCGLVRTPRVSDAAMMAAFAKAESEAGHQPPAAPAATAAPAAQPPSAAAPPGPAPEFQAQFAMLKEQLEAERRRSADLEASNKATAEQRLAETRARIASEAVNFADSEILANRSVPADRDGLIALYQQAALDDVASPSPSVQFGAELVTRVEAIRRTHQKRVPLQLSKETVPVQPGTQALFNQPGTPPATGSAQPMSEERRKQLLSLTQVGRTALNNLQKSAQA